MPRTASIPLRTLRTFAFAALACGFLSAPARACPAIGGLVDFNCDRKLRITVTGDGIVGGVGDDVAGGYVGRLRAKRPELEISNLGVNKVTSRSLLTGFVRLLRNPKTGETKRKSANVDLFLIHVGNNDFRRGFKPAATVRNIKRLVAFLQSELGKDGLVAPFVAVATLTPTLVRKQQVFIDKVNAQLASDSSGAIPALARFDALSREGVSFDRLHPSPEGYQILAGIFESFVGVDVQALLSAQRADADADGVYDIFEGSRFPTSPAAADSDSDGLNDGAEIFTYATDPSRADTDGDGIPDGVEVSAGTNPLA